MKLTRVTVNSNQVGASRAFGRYAYLWQRSLACWPMACLETEILEAFPELEPDGIREAVRHKRRQ